MSDENTSFKLKSGFVAIVGRPNVGKSTLTNRIVGQKVAITSNKPQTTRNRITGVYTDDERGQILFVDTPGIIKAKNKLGEYMADVVKSSVNGVDVILWMIEPDLKPGPKDAAIADKLKGVPVPLILLINKIDSKDKERIALSINAFKDLLDFDEIIPISARRGDGVDELISAIFSYLPYGPNYYDEDMITDQPERQLVAEFIREKSLHALNEEVPHGIAVIVDRMCYRKDKGICDIDATIICEKDSHKGIIIGKGGSMLKKIGSAARAEIEEQLGCQVNLKLFVKVRKNWRDNEGFMKSFGYDIRKM